MNAKSASTPEGWYALAEKTSETDSFRKYVAECISANVTVLPLFVTVSR